MLSRRRRVFMQALEDGVRLGRTVRESEMLSLAGQVRAARPADREPSELGSLRISNRVFRANRRKGGSPVSGSTRDWPIPRSIALTGVFVMVALAVASSLLALGRIGPSRRDIASVRLAGEVGSCAGSLERSRNGEWEQLAAGATLKEGDILRTAPDGRAEIDLADGSIFRMNGATEIVLETCAGREMRLRQLRGGSYHRAATGTSYSLATSALQVDGAGAAFSVDQASSPHGVEVMSLYAGLHVAAEKDAGVVSGNLGEGEKCMVMMEPGTEVSLQVARIAQQDLEQEWLRWNRDRDLEQDRQLGVLAELPVAPVTAESPETGAVEPIGSGVKSIVFSGSWQPPAIALQWTITGYEGYDGLRLFRSHAGSDETAVIELAEETFYLDGSCEPGVEYSYQLALFDADTLVAMSEPIRVLARELPPASQLRLTATIIGTGVELQGAISGDIPFTGYTLLRSSRRSNPSFPLEAGESSIRFTTNDSSLLYLDETVEPGETYYYRLLLLMNGEVILRSNTVMVEYPKPGD
ncbi:MAG: FecR domain-containing protein [Candidatus Geothermincolia bacterium]